VGQLSYIGIQLAGQGSTIGNYLLERSFVGLGTHIGCSTSVEKALEAVSHIVFSQLGSEVFEVLGARLDVCGQKNPELVARGIIAPYISAVDEGTELKVSSKGRVVSFAGHWI